MLQVLTADMVNSGPLDAVKNFFADLTKPAAE